ncbi:glycoside hydrolase family 15 protein [uncultured Odoribacter sp.]|uniref:glycoside hydrolase family 15 protein n=1 Tax=uncultured Odoribacter sp. TaxID=876416 RepID=UPI00260F20C2|nr:glycoside hydrolase family 15 protein [uncultured Odoribacter sp.]
MKTLDYGVIGNCRTAALISAKGSVDWCCFPDFDSPSVFARILDEEKGGCCELIVPDDYTITQQYLDNTNILSTVYKRAEDWFEVLDFMPRYKTSDHDYYLAPEIYRYIRYKQGAPKFRIRYQPAPNYARDPVTHENTGKYIKSYAATDENKAIYLYTGFSLTTIQQSAEITLSQDQYILLSAHQKLIPVNLELVCLEFERTKVYWLNWNNRSKNYTLYNDLIIRSMLVLKLMSYQYTGAVLAAVTTSIPETIGDVRNWDYRFCWLRDASMSIETLLETGHKEGAKRFIGFIRRIIKSEYGDFQIMYGIRGEKVLTEEILPHLAGFENSRPVRIGNGAYNQKQNDSYGYLMDVIYKYYRFDPGTQDEVEEVWAIVKIIAYTITKDWRKPDEGIWEIRNRKEHFVFSKVMCWVALNRAYKIANILNEKKYAERWGKEAELIQKDVMEKGWKEELQSFSQAYDNLEFDSSLLLMEKYGFISAQDVRYRKTVKAVQAALYHKGLMYRYTAHDDFGTPSSAFTICTFWLIRALYVIGEKEEAQAIFERIVTYSNSVGLFSEDLNFDTKTSLGNLPQAYSHLALINTALLFSQEIPASKFLMP